MTLAPTPTPPLPQPQPLRLRLTLEQAELGKLLQSMRLTELGVTEQMVGHFVAQASTTPPTPVRRIASGTPPSDRIGPRTASSVCERP